MLNKDGWLQLFEVCKTKIEIKVEQDIEYDLELQNKCQEIKSKMQLNFTDIREWHYLFQTLYTKILSNQKKIQKKHSIISTKNQTANFNQPYRRSLIKNLRNLELCLQDTN